MTDTPERTQFDRRTVLRGIGTVAVAGAVAGCGGGGGGGGDGGGGDGGDDGGSDGGDGGDGGGGSDGGDGGGGGGGSVPSEVEEYLSETGNYDGSVTDATGQGEVTVMVGAEGNGGNFAYDPPAVRVDTGTTVVWEWTGKGAQHNVVDEDGAYESELVQEEGHTFEHTFEESTNSLYFCTPHKSLGMKGAVIVE